jgi:hypothetical protein
MWVPFIVLRSSATEEAPSQTNRSILCGQTFWHRPPPSPRSSPCVIRAVRTTPLHTGGRPAPPDRGGASQGPPGGLGWEEPACVPTNQRLRAPGPPPSPPCPGRSTVVCPVPCVDGMWTKGHGFATRRCRLEHAVLVLDMTGRLIVGEIELSDDRGEDRVYFDHIFGYSE